MTITLAPEQLAWIEKRIATGEFGSIDEAVGRCVDLAIVEHALIEADDFAWAKPLVDEALAEVERGEVIDIDDLDAFLDKTFGMSSISCQGSH